MELASFIELSYCLMHQVGTRLNSNFRTWRQGVLGSQVMAWFSDTEVRGQLAALGYTHVPDDLFGEFMTGAWGPVVFKRSSSVLNIFFNYKLC